MDSHGLILIQFKDLKYVEVTRLRTAQFAAADAQAKVAAEVLDVATGLFL